VLGLEYWMDLFVLGETRKRKHQGNCGQQLPTTPILSCPLTCVRCVGVGLPQWTSLYVSTVHDAAVESSLPFHCDCGPTIQYKLLILAYKLIN
jgi:hypothetical protein